MEQLDEAGIEEICLVIGENEQAIYDEFFKELPEEYYEKLPENRKRYEDLLRKIEKKITYAVQKERKGFGHAVYQCMEFVNEEPTLLLLGDMIYHSYKNENCMTQMIHVYENYGFPVISMHKISKQDVVHYGILHGQWEDPEETVLKLDEIREKPSIEYAEDHLSIRTKEKKDNYYAVFGQYILTKEVFSALEDLVRENVLENEEIQLTSALEMTRKSFGMIGYVVAGRSYDIGLPEKYLETMIEYGK